MVINLRAIFWMKKLMDLGYIHKAMVVYIKEIGKMIYNKALES